jgi:PAS domain S-box-containing protein
MTAAPGFGDWRRVAIAAALNCLLVPAQLLALDPDKAPEEYVVRVWDEERGFPHRLALALCETRDGYIWVGTQGGLARFDGASFTVFNSANTPAIVESSMRALAETPDGTLWIATLRSDLLRVRAGEVERLTDWLPESWRHGGVRELFVDSRGVLWLTTGDGIGRVEADGRLHVLTAGVRPTDLTYTRRGIVEDPAGRLWISSADGVRSVQGETVSHPLAIGPTRALFASRDGSLWLGCDGKGLLHLRSGRLTPIRLSPGEPTASTRVTAIRGDRHGNIWVGTGSGLFRVQPERGNAVVEMLQGNEVEDVLEDSHGYLWVATRSGLVQVKDPPFRSVAAGRGLQEVISVIEDREGIVWFVTTQPPFLQRVVGGRAVPVPGRLPEGISAVLQDRYGRFLLGCTAGLFVLQGQRWVPLPASPRQPILALAEDTSGALWCADGGGSVQRLSASGTRAFGVAEGLSGARVERLYGARDGSVWVATHDGVFRIHEDRVSELRLGALAAWRYVRHVSEDADGTLWIGSRGGLTRLKDGRLHSFGPQDGLPDPIVHSVVDDRAGHLWVGCSRGIYRVAKADLDRVAAGLARTVDAALYERGDGIVVGQAWGTAAVRSRDGSLWFPTRRGVAMIPAARLRAPSRPPPVFIELAVLNGTPRDTRRLAEVEPGEGRLEFRFTALSFDAPHRTLFRYRLEGLDSQWREVMGQREALYANVRAGRYVFRVAARSADGIWNREGATFAFVLAPHWYETWWWRSLVVLVLAGLVFTGHRRRVRRLERRERELAQRVDERTRDLQREVADRAQAEEAVRRLAGSLEERVGERTAELETAKARLEEDVAIRQRAEEALSAEKERLAVTLRSIADGVVATDVRGQIALMNRVAEELTGWTQAQAVERPLSEVFRLVDRWTRKPLPDPVEAVIRGGAARELPDQALLLCHDGRERLIADSAAPIRDPSSRITGAVLVFRDVTERRRTEEHLANADKLASIGILAAGIAHDFNNLLTGIFGHIDLALRDCPDGGLVQRRLSKAVEVVERARGLSSQLLTFTTGGAPVTAPTDLAVHLRNGARFALAGSNVSSEIDIPDDLWLCDIDAGQIGQVIDNIVINARQAMPAGGRIVIRASNETISDDPLVRAGRYVCVSIADRGGGIPAELRSRIFDPFFTTKPGGTGLGLATAHSIVKRHRGHIEFDSVVNEGTTFRLYLPATAGAAPGPIPSEEVATLHGRVLVMDDEEFVREVARDSLAGLGLRVETVPDGATAIERVRAALNANDPFDLAILDLTIAGGMGGVETLAQLRTLQPALKAIASSGYSIDPVMADPTAFGFEGTLPKPYTRDDLIRTIRPLLGGGADGERGPSAS